MLFDSLAKRNEFIENNLGLVKSRVMKLNKNIFNDDLYQVGSLALVVATDRFDRGEGTEFSTYAVKYIDGYILKYKRHDFLIKPMREGSKTWNFLYKDVVSINEKISDGESSLGDTIYINDNVEQFVIDRILVNDFMNSLSDRDRLIIELTIDGLTQEKISKIVRTHRTNVSRIVSRRGKQYVNCYAI